MKSKRTRLDDWVRAGIEILRAHGEEALTIDRLAKRLRRTKGSFYHHFVDIGAFRTAVLDAWSASHTLGPIARADGESLSRRRAKLYAVVSELDHRLEIAVRAWATRSEDARRARDAIDERRVAYLTTLWVGAGKRARELAEIEYATFLGLLDRHGEGYVAHATAMQTLILALSKL